MHIIGMMKVWLFSPPKKKMGRGELGKKSWHFHRSVLYMYMLFKYIGAKKKNCDIKHYWLPSTILQDIFWITEGISQKVWLRSDSSAGRREYVLFLSCIQALHLLVIYQDPGLNHLYSSHTLSS